MQIQSTTNNTICVRLLDAQIERVEVSLSREYVCLSAALMQRHQTEK